MNPWGTFLPFIFINSHTDFATLNNVTFEIYFVNMLKVGYRFINASQFVVGVMQVILL